MSKFVSDNRGVALLIVIVLMALTIAIASMALYISARGGKMAYDYGNGIRSLKIAEAGADLVIGEWSGYVLKRKATGILSDPLNIGDFKSGTALDSKIASLQAALVTVYNNQDLSLSIVNYSTSSITPGNYVSIDIEGRYDQDTCLYQVKLTYDLNGTISYFKEF